MGAGGRTALPCLGVRPTITYTHSSGVACSRGVVSDCLSFPNFGSHLQPQHENESTRRSKFVLDPLQDLWTKILRWGQKWAVLLWRTAAEVFPKMIARVGRSTTTRLWAVTGWTSSDQCTTNIDICVDDEYVWDDVAQCINVNRCESIGLCMLLCVYVGTNSVLLIGSVYIYRTQFFCVSFCLQFVNLMYLSMYLLICP